MKRCPQRIARLISGGQSGVDRGALDAALELGLPCGGWCPKGRKAEDGTIPARYPLAETPSRGYRQRTRWNIRDSDGTLILSWGSLTGGTRFTMDECRRVGKPFLVIDLAGLMDLAGTVKATRAWITTNLPGGVLNVAGPRGSEHPAIFEQAKAFMWEVLGLSAEA